MKFYNEIPDMEFLSGDTLPAFHVQVEGSDAAGSTMECIVCRSTTPTVAVITKACTPESGGFMVQLTSEDTAQLIEGSYQIHFRLMNNGLSLRKLKGNIYVHSVAGGSTNG